MKNVKTFLGFLGDRLADKPIKLISKLEIKKSTLKQKAEKSY
jgi:hypothetical protein